MSRSVTACQSPVDTLMPSERLGAQRCQNVHKTLKVLFLHRIFIIARVAHGYIIFHWKSNRILL